MLLFDPSPGQIADRLTILALKLEAAKKNQGITTALEVEAKRCQDELLTRKESLPPTKYAAFGTFYDHLSNQNSLNWNLENSVRVTVKEIFALPLAQRSPDKMLFLCNLVKGFTEGNLRRSKLVQAIDELFGIIPEVKFYS